MPRPKHPIPSILARKQKSQSAMEYLMTYGWAILIIAVVLAALFQLGVFSGVTSPRAQPGTCRVIRPSGPGTSAYASLQGVCTGLLPQFVAQFGASNANSAITNSNMAGQVDNLPNYTISMWLNPHSTGSALYTEGDSSGCQTFRVGGQPLYVASWNVGYVGLGYWLTWQSSANLTPNAWQLFTLTLSNGGSGSGTGSIYLNGVLEDSGTSQEEVNSGTHVGIIGEDSSGCSSAYTASSYVGQIANVQIYNSSLTENEVLALYKEGIGGAPIHVDTLIGWWPLNGNANDTSGNLNNGVPTAVTYTSSWTGGYSLS